MWNDSEVGSTARERLSALLDGELEHAAVTEACSHWTRSAESRSTWHAYHLIGDVLRSDDLACHPARDANFLAALRARMADEPVVLAPESPAPVAASPAAAASGAARNKRPWIAPAAIAAGFAVVVLSVVRPGASPDTAASGKLALANPSTMLPAPLAAPAAPVKTVAERPQVANAQAPSSPATDSTMVPVVDVRLIRDARLDRYLAAHQQFAGSSALGVPSAYLRNAAVVMSGR